MGGSPADAASIFAESLGHKDSVRKREGPRAFGTPDVWVGKMSFENGGAWLLFLARRWTPHHLGGAAVYLRLSTYDFPNVDPQIT